MSIMRARCVFTIHGIDMPASNKLHNLAVLFENNSDLSPKNQDLHELIDLLNEDDNEQLDRAIATLQKYKKENPSCTTLLTFITQYRKVKSEASLYKDTLQVVQDNVDALKENADAIITPVSTSSYFKILELAGHHVSMYESQDDRIHRACLKLNVFFTQSGKELKFFKEFYQLEQASQKAFDELNIEFQKELKDNIFSGDILQPSVEKEEKIIPGLHDNETLWDKIYFWFKNKLTKHAHSALMVYDRNGDNQLHYSHVVDTYQHNSVELHHFLYSNVYRVKPELFPVNEESDSDKGKDALDEYRIIHENLYDLVKEEAYKDESEPNSSPQVRLENNTVRKILSGFVNLLYRIVPFIGRWIAKDTSQEEAIKSVLVAPSTKDPNTPTKPTKMFCSEFVANSMSIAASQSFALFDQWKIHRRARYLPPEGLAKHLQKENLVEEIGLDELNIPLTRMFRE